MRILVLESSTTSAKAMLYSSREGILRSCSQPYAAEHNQNGMQDADYVLAETLRMGREAADGGPVDLITVGGVWHSVLCCDRVTMQAVTPVYSWSYTGAAAFTRELRADKAYTLDYYHRCGCMPHVTYSPFKLMYLSRREGLELADKVCCEQSAYNFYRLTGVCASSATTASGGGLINLNSRDYDPDILREVGIQRDQLPELRTYRDTLPLSPQGAALLGLKSGIPVLPPMPDGGLNQVGAGAQLPGGPMTLSVGTSAALRRTTQRPLLSDPPSTWCYLAPGGGYISGAATAGACNCLDWALDRFFPAGTTHAQAQKAPVPRELPVFLPFLFGERCPGWRDDRPAALPDLRETHSAPHLYYGVMQGVLFNLYQCYQILCGLSGVPDAIKLSGGILRSPVWVQMCCDIFAHDMDCPDLEQASMLGAAALALEVGGDLPSSQDFPQPPQVTVHYSPDAHARYEQAFQAYLQCYHSLS